MNGPNTDFLPLYDVDDDMQCFDHAFCSSPASIFLDSEESDHPETEGIEDISVGPNVFDGNSPDGVRSPPFEMEYESDSSSWPYLDWETRRPGDDGCQIFVADDLPEDIFSSEGFSDLDNFSMDVSLDGDQLLGSRRDSGTPEAVPLDIPYHPTTDSEELEMDDFLEAVSPLSTRSATECIEAMVISFLTQILHASANDPDDPDCVSESRSLTGSLCPDKKKAHIFADDKPPPSAKPRIELLLVERKKGCLEDGSLVYKKMSYPKRRPTGSLKPFAQLFKVLDVSHEAITTGIAATKRDTFYKDVGLFKSQRVVDVLVDDLAATFELSRSDLNIRSSSKGLVCGSGLSVTLLTGEIISVNDTEGTLIPPREDIKSFFVDDSVSWVLVVEKEAVFQTLCRLELTTYGPLGRGILITGKGYPDVPTRHLVKSLADSLHPKVPILGFMDADPYGLDILSVYKYGSRAMQHENEWMAAGRIRWLGLRASECRGELGIGRDGLLAITKRDERKAREMLFRTNRLPKSWRRELQEILFVRRKAEIELISQCPSTGFGATSLEKQKDSRRYGQPLPLDVPTSGSSALLHYLVGKITKAVTKAHERHASSS